MAYPTDLDSFSLKIDNLTAIDDADINDIQDSVEALEAKVGVTTSADFDSLDHKVNNFIATGRKAWFYNPSAPLGWTVSGISDVVVAIEGGSGTLYDGEAGNVAGESWSNLKAHIHTGPSHTHPVPARTSGACSDNSGASGGTSVAAGYHTHTVSSGNTNAGGTENTGAQSTADIRPTAAVGIIAEKG